MSPDSLLFLEAWPKRVMALYWRPVYQFIRLHRSVLSGQSGFVFHEEPVWPRTDEGRSRGLNFNTSNAIAPYIARQIKKNTTT